MSSDPHKLKRAVIKEELVAITGDFMSALVLNQFIYWTERTRDIDAYIAEEKARDPNAVIEPTSGWIYKKADELAGELMVDVAHTTMRRYLKGLVDRGFLEQRHNPKHTWDRTWQYRVNMLEVQRQLLDHGFSLEGYQLQDIGASTTNNRPTSSDAHSKVQNAHSILQNAHSNVRNTRAIPETTPETTTESGGVAPSTQNQDTATARPERKVAAAALTVDQTLVARLEAEQGLNRDQATKAAALDCVTNESLDQLLVWRTQMLDRNQRLPVDRQKNPTAILASYFKRGALPDDLPAPPPPKAPELTEDEKRRRYLENFSSAPVGPMFRAR